MKKSYGIGLFSAVLLILVLLTVGYNAEYQHQKELAQEEQETEKNKKEETEILSTQGDAQKEELFYLKNLNGYIVVYLADRQTIYEYTSIPVESLPETLQREMIYGKQIRSLEKVYGFLENYSS